jgi:ubiquinone/menaquinone biosynthesis C-methylase UbiE
METRQAYAQWASSYDSDRNLTRDLDEVITRTFLGGLNFKSILEIGCGTGKNTSLFARIGEQVRALDFSEEMIAQARRKSSAANVEFTLADITQRWPVDGASIDLISCNLVLEHIADLNHVFAQAVRVLTNNGRLFISELHPFRQYQGTVATFTCEDAVVKIPAFVHHISDFLDAAVANGLSLLELNEWWHSEDEGKPPRLVTFMFAKSM